ncbi:hypothetical protein [Rhodoferax lacus]|nr:hypothetical protein [Rhodoferax lacus]
MYILGFYRNFVQDIEQERSSGSVQTMNRIFGMLGLKLGVARTSIDSPT